jgi:SP family general alpha glucoside:H+ symporter-like MFS transporter
MAAGALAQQVGRRWTAFAFSILSIAGTFILFFATSRGMLLAGKTINGAVVGGLMTIGTTYAADVSIGLNCAPVVSHSDCVFH